MAATPRVNRIPPKKLQPEKPPPLLASGLGLGDLVVTGAAVVVAGVSVDVVAVVVVSVEGVVVVAVVVVEVVSVVVSGDVVVVVVEVVSGTMVVMSDSPLPSHSSGFKNLVGRGPSADGEALSDMHKVDSSPYWTHMHPCTAVQFLQSALWLGQLSALEAVVVALSACAGVEEEEEVEDEKVEEEVEDEAPAASSGLGVGRAGVTGLGSTGDADTWPGQSGPSRLQHDGVTSPVCAPQHDATVARQ